MSEDTIRTLLLAAIALAALAVAFFVFRSSPRALMVVWALVLFFVPIWVGVQAGVFYSAITVITLLVIMTSTLHGVRFALVDYVLVSFTILLVGAWALGWVTWGHLLIALVGWMIPYAGGRLVSTRVGVGWVHSCIAGGATVAAVLAIVEFVTGVNPFVLIRMGNGLYTTWGTLQYRGGELRVEGAFGHSIAFGSALAVSSVFILVARWPLWMRVTALLIVTTAVGLTFSRIGLIGLVLTLVCAIVFLREVTRAARIAVGILFGGLAVVGLPLLFEVFTEAGVEASGSAAYRTDLTTLIDRMSPLGITPSWSVLANGETYYGSFQSIDSELILAGLRYGLIPALLIIAALACCVVVVLRGQANPATIAVLGQIPALATVALITQYTSLLCFVAGLAVASYQARRPYPQAESVRPLAVPMREKETAWLL